MSITCYDSDNNLLKTLYQWDNNQTMKVSGITMPPMPSFHFCNRLSNIALVVTPEVSGSDLIVSIPNILLQQAEPIIAYVYQGTEGDGNRTMHTIHIPVIPRPKPDDYEYEENIEYLSMAILNSRLLELIHNLSDASEASCAAEVIDIRIGYDGTVYDTAGEAVRALGTELSGMKEEIEQYVDAKAVDGLFYEDNMLYLTSNGEIVSDPILIVSGSGGGGGGGGSSVSYTITLTNLLPERAFAVADGQPANLQFSYASVDGENQEDGSGIGNLIVGGVNVSSFSVPQGNNTINIAQYLHPGSNTVK